MASANGSQIPVSKAMCIESKLNQTQQATGEKKPTGYSTTKKEKEKTLKIYERRKTPKACF